MDQLTLGVVAQRPAEHHRAADSGVILLQRLAAEQVVGEARPQLRGAERADGGGGGRVIRAARVALCSGWSRSG